MINYHELSNQGQHGSGAPAAVNEKRSEKRHALIVSDTHECQRTGEVVDGVTLRRRDADACDRDGRAPGKSLTIRAPWGAGQKSSFSLAGTARRDAPASEAFCCAPPRFSRAAKHIAVPLCPAKGFVSGWAGAIARRGCFGPFRVIIFLFFFYLHLVTFAFSSLQQPSFYGLD
jgi:hypothetical protein